MVKAAASPAPGKAKLGWNNVVSPNMNKFDMKNNAVIKVNQTGNLSEFVISSSL